MYSFTSSASVGGSPEEAAGGGGWLWLTVGTRKPAAEVLGSTLWHEPSRSTPTYGIFNAVFWVF